MTKAIQDFYKEDFSFCYGCGRNNSDGYHLKTFLHKDTTISKFMPSKKHIAVKGYVYGGLLASLIDCHGTGSASIFYAKKNNIVIEKYNAPRFVTGSLNIKYLKPTPLHEELIIKGKLKEITLRKVITKVEVFVKNDVCVTAEVIAILVPDNF